MLSAIIDNKNGTMWDVSNIVSAMTWKTSRMGKAATLELTLVTDSLPQGFDIQNGNQVRVKLDGEPVMLGYVFKIDDSEDDTVKLTIYDQMRYLQGTNTYVFVNQTATAIIQRIATDMQLTVGSLTSTQFAIPKQSEDTQRLLDMIVRALDQTTVQTGEIFVLYDDYGKLTLKNYKDMVLDLIVGDSSLLTGFKRSRSIENAANYIKVAQDDTAAGNRKIYAVKDSESIRKWGLLIQYVKVDDGLNEAQVLQIRDQLAEKLVQESLDFSVDALGDIRVRAGCTIGVSISEIGINQLALIEDCTHKWSGGDHTMTLTLKVVKPLE